MQTTAPAKLNRRHRRLIPAAMIVAALSLANTGLAHAATPKPARPAPAHVRSHAAPSVAVVPRLRDDHGEAAARVVGL